MTARVPKVKLYKPKSWYTRIHLVLTNTGVENINMSFGDADWITYKGSTNDIEFEIKDNDRKPVNVEGMNPYITIIDHDTRKVVLEKPLDVLDPVKGKLKFRMYPFETVDLYVGYYNYSIQLEYDDGTKHLLYTDLNYSASGWFELKDNALPNHKPAEELEGMDKWTPTHQGVYPGGFTKWTSSSVKGDAAHGFKDGLHTVALYLQNYTGKLKMEGSLEINPPTDEQDWFDINLSPNTIELNFMNYSGIEPFNFTANVSWLRFIAYPDEELNKGTITKVLVKI